MRTYGMALLVALCITNIAGAVPDENDKLGLREALAIAMRQNPSLLAAKSQVEAAKANERGARALTNPELTIAPTVAGTAGSDAGVSVVQRLEVNGVRQARGGVAREETKAAQAGYEVAEHEVSRQVKQAYWSVARAQHMLDLNRENVTLAEALYQAAKRQFDVGTSPGSQSIKAQVELARARQELAGAESGLAQAKASLNILMGRPSDTPFTLSDELTFTPVALDRVRLKATAQSNRPEVTEARALLTAREVEVKASTIRRRPDLVLQARQEEVGQSGGIAVGIFLPLIDWGSAKQDRRRAEAEVNAQSRRLEAVRNAVSLDLESALIEADRAEKLIREYQQGVISQAERLADMAQKGYKAGATGYLEVLEAQRTLRTVRTEYYTALADHRSALAQVEWAAGVDLSTVTLQEATR